MAPLSAILVLTCLWMVELVAVIWLAIRDTWLAPLVPIGSLVAVLLIYEYGSANLSWGGVVDALTVTEATNDSMMMHHTRPHTEVY